MHQSEGSWGSYRVIKAVCENRIWFLGYRKEPKPPGCREWFLRSGESFFGLFAGFQIAVITSGSVKTPLAGQYGVDFGKGVAGKEPSSRNVLSALTVAGAKAASLGSVLQSAPKRGAHVQHNRQKKLFLWNSIVLPTCLCCIIYTYIYICSYIHICIKLPMDSIHLFQGCLYFVQY